MWSPTGHANVTWVTVPDWLEYSFGDSPGIPWDHTMTPLSLIEGLMRQPGPDVTISGTPDPYVSL
jgi:hypothetical protein